MRSTNLRVAAAAAALTSVVGVVHPALGVATNWTFNGSGNWSVASNWSLAVPFQNADTNISFNDAIARTINYDYTGAQVTLNSLVLNNNNSTGATTLSQPGGIVTTLAETVASSGFATLSISGGTHNVIGTSFGALSVSGTSTVGAGTVLLSGTGVLNVMNGPELIGAAGAATFNQSGGTHNFSTIYLGYGGNGTYLLSGSGATMSGGQLNVGLIANGNFSQSGGSSSTLTQYLDIGINGNGTYTLNGGSLTTPYTFVGGSGSGTFNHFAGTHTLSGGLNVGDGDGVGTYNLSGASTLSVQGAVEYLGNAGRGIINQSGGLHTVNTFLYMADQVGSAGTYNLSGGTLSVANTEHLGFNGPATFNQLFGMNSAGQFVIIADTNPASSALYTLSGGTLSAGTVLVNPNGVLTHSGGYITAPTIKNYGTYNANGGDFTGLLVNFGTVNFNADDFLSGSIENDASLTIGPGRAINVFGAAGLRNLGALTLNNGTLGTSILTNDVGASMAGRGAISGTLDNRGSLQVTGPLSTANGITNSGAITVPAGAVVKQGVISNTGVITLTGGAVSSTINNNASGVVQGAGNIAAGLANNAGGVIYANAGGGAVLTLSSFGFNQAGAQLKVADASTLAAPLPLNNAGIIALQGINAAMSGGTITNTGTIKGAGRVGNNVNNTAGTIRAEGGELDFTGSFNASGATGQLQVGAGNTVAFTQAPFASAGTITLTGGTVDTNGFVLSNNGTTAGHGTLRTGGLSNAGTMNLGGGNTDVLGGTMSNLGASHVTVTGGPATTATFYGDVVNNTGAQFRVDAGSTAVFLGNVTGVGAITGGGTKYYAGSAAGGAVAAAGTTVVASTGGLTVDAIRENDLRIDGVVTINPNGTSASTSRVNTLSIAGAPDASIGRLDLNDNALVVDYTGGSPIATIQNQIKSGFAGGAWTGNGITSSAAASAASSPHRTSLGYAEASALGVASFSGQSVDATSVLIRYTYAGDSNLNGTVDLTDFTYLAANFNGTGKNWLQGDYNYDGSVDLTDFTFLASNFNQSLSSIADGGSLGLSVPEPAALSLSLLCAAFARRRRRRRA